MFQKWENKQKRYKKWAKIANILKLFEMIRLYDYPSPNPNTNPNQNPNLTLTLTITITNPLISATLIERNIFGSILVYFENFPSFR